MSQEYFNEETISNINSFHLAGIVPVSGQPLDYNLPWHDCLQPIAQNFLAIERAVLECATAGCETIWVVCPSKMQPLIKYRLGEMVEDPVWVGRKHDYFPSESKKAVPIFYVEVHPKDQDKKESLAGSVDGANRGSFFSSTVRFEWVRFDIRARSGHSRAPRSQPAVAPKRAGARRVR